MPVTMRKPRHNAPSAAQRARSASAAAEGERADNGRWSSRRRSEVVPRLFRGETLDALSRGLGVSPGRLAASRDEAIAAIQAGLQSREPDHRDGFIHDLKAKVGD
jgi:transposase